jgi:hypothetical protein
MNRRSFFRFLGAGAATLALSEAIPFGRVWSFPSKIVVPLQPLSWGECFEAPTRVGQTIRIRFPQHWIVRDFGEYTPAIITPRAENFVVTSLSPLRFDRPFPRQLA